MLCVWPEPFEMIGAGVGETLTRELVVQRSPGIACRTGTAASPLCSAARVDVEVQPLL